METTTGFVAKIVGLAVILLVVVSCALPVIGDIKVSLKEVNENVGESYHAIDASASTASISYSSGTLTIDDWSIETTTSTVLVSESFSIRVDANGMKIFDTQNTKINTAVSAVSIDSGTFTYTSGGVEYTGDLLGNVMLLSEEGEYGRFSNGSIKVNTDSQLTISYINSAYYPDDPEGSNLNGVISYATGTYRELVANIVAGTHVITNPTATLTDVTEDEEHGYTTIGNSVLWAMQSDGDGYHRTAIATIFAPIEYKEYTSDGLMMLDLINILPILLVFIPVMLAVRMLGSGRN